MYHRFRKTLVRANPLLKVIVKFTVKITGCMSLRLAAYGEFYCEFDYDFQEWSCSYDRSSHAHVMHEREYEMR